MISRVQYLFAEAAEIERESAIVSQTFWLQILMAHRHSSMENFKHPAPIKLGVELFMDFIQSLPSEAHLALGFDGKRIRYLGIEISA